MRKLFWIMSISVLLAVSMTSAVKAVELEEVELGRGTVVLTSGYINLQLRVEPNLNAGRYILIPNGSDVSVYEELSDDWLRIGYGGYVGYVQSKWIKYTAHNLEYFVGMTTNPCEVETYDTLECLTCGYEVIVKVNPALGHDLFTVYLGPDLQSSYSCEIGGYKVTQCRRSSRCRYSEYVEIAPGHVYTEVSLIKPTYHSDGTQTVECDRCGYRDYITIPMLIADGMSPDVFAMGQAFMSGVWKLFGVYVPGFGFTFGGMLIGVALVSLSLSVIYMVFGFGRRGGAVSARSGSTSKAKISKERENDER